MPICFNLSEVGEEGTTKQVLHQPKPMPHPTSRDTEEQSTPAASL